MSRDRFAAAAAADRLDLACALMALEADPAADVEGALGHLDMLATLARPLLDAAPSGPGGQAEALRLALGEEAGFSGGSEDYDDVRSSLLPDVLRRRRGLPVLLCVVWLEVARRLAVPAFALAIPGEVVAGIGAAGGEYVIVDPFRGGAALTVHDVAGRIRAAGAQFSRELLVPTPPSDLLLRILGNIRLLATRTGDVRTRLWAVELSLLLPRHPAALRRERGELLTRLGDFRAGAAELESYAEAVSAAEPAAAEAARASARMARARLN